MCDWFELRLFQVARKKISSVMSIYISLHESNVTIIIYSNPVVHFPLSIFKPILFPSKL